MTVTTEAAEQITTDNAAPLLPVQASLCGRTARRRAPVRPR